MPIASIRCPLLIVFLLLLAAAPGQGAQPASEEAASSEETARFKKFESMMSGVKLVGQFTVTGREKRNPADEEYTISSVKKLPQGDYWLINARIKYGDRDVTLPLPLEVKWAGDTPVITLTELTIPVLGTFSSRVVFDDNKYAGTWSHGEVGGHLFGIIKKEEQSAGE